VITNFVVGAVVALAAAFVLAWLARKDFRDRIEQPKHNFLDRLERYDRQCSERSEGEASGRARG
jgi:hypothetical protein